MARYHPDTHQSQLWEEGAGYSASATPTGTRSQYVPVYRYQSQSGSASPSSANTYHAAPSMNHYSTAEPSPTLHATGPSGGLAENPHHRSQHIRPDNHHQYQPNMHRNDDYNQRSPRYSHQFLPTQHLSSSFGNQSEADYHHSIIADERDRERRRMHHSNSASSILSTTSTKTSHSVHAGSMSSPPLPCRSNGQSLMEAPPLHHRTSYSSASRSTSAREAAHPQSDALYNASSPLEGADESGSNAAAGQQPLPGDRKISCLECRSSKVKCTGQTQSGRGCERCQRIRRECVFEQHRRGRKPTQLKMNKLEQSVDTIMTALSALQEFKKKKEAIRQMTEEENEDDQKRPYRIPLKRRSISDSTESQSQYRKTSRSNSGVSAGGKVEGYTEQESPKESLSPLKRSKHSNEKIAKRLPLSEETDAKDQDKVRHLHLLSEGTETPRDGDLEPEEGQGQELGLPSLSNPLKLLAQASGSSMDRNKLDASAPTPLKGDYDEVEQETLKDNDKNSKGNDQLEPTSSERVDARQRGASRREYWAFGLYSSRFDKGLSLDPIMCNIVSKEVAKDLFGLYMRHLNARITLLDPFLASFNYVRGHSALLLTSACALAARFASHIPNAEELANKLDVHVQEKLLPAILLQGYRSVEISQAFIIMAAYHANTSSLDGDRSWSLLGYGIRIAAELDMNARMVSERERFTKSAQTPASAHAETPSSSKMGEEENQLSAEETIQRRLRNRERTWCNLWLFENSLSTHMGRRSTLGQDPVILGVAAGWDRAHCAIPGDEAIVALINLRRIQIKNVEYFEHSILNDVIKQSDAGAPRDVISASLKFQLQFYRNSCGSDLNAWRAMYIESDEGQSVRMKNARLYMAYARLILNSYALKCTTDQTLLEPIYKESYNSAMCYLTLFCERLESPELVYVHNSAVVTVAYVAVFALRLCSLDPKRYPYIDSAMVFDHVRALTKALARAGNVTSWRNGAASSYAPYLSAVLQRVEKTFNKETGAVEGPYDPATSPSAPVYSATGYQVDMNPSQVPNSTQSVPPGSQMTRNPDVTQQDQTSFFAMTPSSTKRLSFAAASSMSKLNQEALSFMAGPSGVQASAVLEELTTNEGLQFGQNFFEDQIMDASLFSDMSVFLNTKTTLEDQQQYPWLAPQTIGLTQL